MPPLSNDAVSIVPFEPFWKPDAVIICVVYPNFAKGDGLLAVMNHVVRSDGIHRSERLYEAEVLSREQALRLAVTEAATRGIHAVLDADFRQLRDVFEKEGIEIPR